jgi:hypothetical protein
LNGLCSIEAIALHPIDLPKRVTKVRVQWQSGVVTELEVPRPESGQAHSHRPEVVQRIRDLAAAGIHDEEIGRQLNSEGLHTGTGRLWYLDLVRTMRSRFGIKRVARDRQRNPPLPHRHPDGRYSVPGLVARLGVSEAIVHGWIKRGVIPATRADFGTHQNVYWLEIDDATATRLTALLRRRRP